MVQHHRAGNTLAKVLSQCWVLTSVGALAFVVAKRSFPSSRKLLVSFI
jgi:hypothetical protein